jgi:hypothetical protein
VLDTLNLRVNRGETEGFDQKYSRQSSFADAARGVDRRDEIYSRLTLALAPARVHDAVTRPMKLRRGARASWARSFA